MGYGNLAYKYDYTEEQHEKQKKNINRKKPAKRAKKTKKLSYAAKIASVLMVAASAVFMITQYVTVNETQSELTSAISDCEFEESVTAQKAFELEQSIDLSKVETEATSRLGMRRPEKHQIVYVDVKKSDKTVKTAKEVEGFASRAAGLVKSVKSHIIKFFSI